MKYFSAKGWRWQKILKGVVTRAQEYLRIRKIKEMLVSYRTINKPNEIRRWNAGSRFTIKSVYAIVRDEGIHDTQLTHIWKLVIPVVKIFLWLALRKRIPTIDNLLKRGWPGNTICVLCSDGT